jgi:hypothetical protein
MLEELEATISRGLRTCFPHVHTSNNGQLCPAKNSIGIEVGDLELLLKLLLGQKRPLRLGFVLGHYYGSYEDQQKTDRLVACLT